MMPAIRLMTVAELRAPGRKRLSASVVSISALIGSNGFEGFLVQQNDTASRCSLIHNILPMLQTGPFSGQE
jgi:hypothetical protein